MKNDVYQQCRLAKRSIDNTVTQISWIPQKFCVKGKILNLDEKNSDGLKFCDKGWEVVDVYASIRTSQEINERSQDYKKTRRASDI